MYLCVQWHKMTVDIKQQQKKTNSTIQSLSSVVYPSGQENTGSQVANEQSRPAQPEGSVGRRFNKLLKC